MRALIAILISTMFLSSCYTRQQASKQIAKAQAIYPAELARHCGLYYPPIESSHTTEKIIQGKDSVITDTQYVDCTEPANEGNKNVPVPTQHSRRVDTFYKSSTRVEVNTARIEAQAVQIGELKSANAVLNDKLKTVRRQLYASLAACAISVILLIKKIF